MIRKYATSPTQNRSLSISGKLSPNLLKPNLKSSSSHHSPKHSPAHVPSSPKHSINISSPKSHGTSPKHPSTSGSGKPSMSTLKSAANSPSSKNNNNESKSKSNSSNSRDKEKKNSNLISSSGKIKAAVKVKELSNSSEQNVINQDNLPSPSEGVDLSKSSSANQARNRKSSLSQIVDKLKSFQHCDGSTEPKTNNRERPLQTTSKSDVKGTKIGENKNSEYMVKPSSDGIKITINKTRKEASKNSGTLTKSSSGSGSPKLHTGLKPGVTSGPASKKPQQLAQKATSNANSTNYAFKSSFKVSGNPKSSSSSTKSISKLNSPKSATDLTRKDRPKINKSNSEKSIFSGRDGRKSSPTQNVDDDKAFKITVPKTDPYSSALMVEGIVNKFDKSFQIPKLSARTSDDKKLPNKVNNLPELNNIARTENQMFDLMNKNDLSLPKYPPLPISNKLFDATMETKIRNNMNTSSPLTATVGSPKKETDSSTASSSTSTAIDNQEVEKKPQNLCTGKDEINFKLNYTPISATTKSFPSTPTTEPLSLSTKSVDLTSRFVAPAPKDEKKDKPSTIVNKSESDLIDYSNVKDTSATKTPISSNNSSSNSISSSCTTTTTTTAQMLPHSPSVSVHITPSPLINPSPHSASPCITDDELMDEALVGLGK